MYILYTCFFMVFEGRASDPLSPSNVPNPTTSDPNTSSNDPFRQPNVHFHTRRVNSSTLELLKYLEESSIRSGFRASVPFSPSNVPFSPSNVPNQMTSDPTPSTSDPFRHINARFHTTIDNLSSLITQMP